MQILSNLILNVIFLYPLIVICEYCQGETRKVQLKMIKDVAFIIFMTNFLMIDSGYFLETYIMFYIMFLVTAGIYMSFQFAKISGIKISMFSEGQIIGIKESKVFILSLGYVFLFILLYFVNVQSDFEGV